GSASGGRAPQEPGESPPFRCRDMDAHPLSRVRVAPLGTSVTRAPPCATPLLLPSRSPAGSGALQLPAPRRPSPSGWAPVGIRAATASCPRSVAAPSSPPTTETKAVAPSGAKLALAGVGRRLPHLDPGDRLAAPPVADEHE